MRSYALRQVHKLALSDKRFEQQLMQCPRAVLQSRSVPEAEICLIETLAPQNAIALGLVIEAVEKALYELQDDTNVLT